MLVAGVLLAPGRRTVTATLRIMGLDQAAGFAVYHRVLSLGRWSSRALAHRLLLLLVAAFVPTGTGCDRPRRHHRAALGCEDQGARDLPGSGALQPWPLRQSQRPALVVRDAARARSRGPGCVWALPFLSVLAPSERYATERGQRHKKLTDWARQGLLQTVRWLPGRRVIAVGDSSFSAIELLRDVGPAPVHDLAAAARCRPLRASPTPQARHARATTGQRRSPAKPAGAAGEPGHTWQPGQRRRLVWPHRARLHIASGTALWHHPGMQVPIRWVLVRDPSGEKEPQAFLCTDLDADPVDILRWFVRRWRVETTFEEARRHLGLETQRQWSDLAILRTTPALLGLISLVTLWATQLEAAQRSPTRVCPVVSKTRANLQRCPGPRPP